MEQTELSPAVRYAVWVLVAVLGFGVVCLGAIRYQEERRAAAAALEAAGTEKVPAVPAGTAASAGPDAPAPKPELVVHVTGAVVRSGVFRLPEGARVEDALAAAGGVTPEGAPEVLNLAARVSDGDKIYVPTRKEARAESQLSPAARGATVGIGESPAASATGSPGRVSINRASAAELEQVNGIGPAIARAIVEYRTKHGPFQRLEDLEKVPGIGPRTMEKLLPHLTL
ncbi:MAG TPA: helix-hairpin-helix domain-containing protein [Symbiobacteriaceae bacterium]